MSSDPILPTDPEPEPMIPPQSVPPAAVTPTSPISNTEASATLSGLDPNIAAGLSALTSGLAGVVFLVLEKRNPFVRFWAMQSVFFGASVLVLNIAVSIFLGILGHIIGFLVGIFYLLYAVVCLGILVLWIFMIIQAFSGKEWEIPVLGKMARRQLARMPIL